MESMTIIKNSDKCGECSGNYWRPKPGQDWAYFRCVICNKKEKKAFTSEVENNGQTSN